MKALITGAGGQLAREWIAGARPGWTITALTRQQLDIADGAAVARAIQATGPDLVVNAAAYTAVDRAEGDPDAAWLANREGAANVARAAAAVGARLLHISTDFVFDGRSGRAYRPDDPTSPLGVYGASKLAGEQSVRESHQDALTVRTSWVYAGHGRNFLLTMLRLMNAGATVRVVADQIGAPTSASSLAAGLWDLIDVGAVGLYHYTDAGVASWYDFAQAIAEEAGAVGLAPANARVTPISTSEYPTAALRPPFSVLDTAATWARLGRAAPHWRVALRAVLAAMGR